jgi:hypothetical protein
LSSSAVTGCQLDKASTRLIDRKRDEIRAQLNDLPDAMIEIIHGQLRLLLGRS